MTKIVILSYLIIYLNLMVTSINLKLKYRRLILNAILSPTSGSYESFSIKFELNIVHKFLK